MGTADATAELAGGDSGRYQRPDFAAALATQPNEYSYWITEVEGEVPSSLRGTLFRNGPGRFERGEQKYAHVLDGDGYVYSFSFNQEGRVYFRSAYVRTSELEKETKADAVLFRNAFGTAPKKRSGILSALGFPNAFDTYLKNPANTNVVFWGNKLLALYEAGQPWQMDPYTLKIHPGPDTLGDFLKLDSGFSNPLVTLWEQTFDREKARGQEPPHANDKQKGKGSSGVEGQGKPAVLGKSCTAHPHVVHGEGMSDRLTMFSSHIQVKPSGLEVAIDVAEFDEQWQRVAGQQFNLQNTLFVPHDFAVSPSYYIFFYTGSRFDLVQFLLGRQGPAQCLNMTDDPMKIYLIPRNGDKPIVIDNVEPCFLIHYANAYEEGDEVVVQAIGWGPEIVRELAAMQGSGVFGTFSTGDYNKVPITSLWSHRINVKTGKVKRDCLMGNQRNDHPRVNPCFYSKPTRYAYVNACMPPDGNAANPPQAYVRVDTQTGEKQTWFPGVRCFCEELVFVPGPNAATQETDGFLLGMVLMLPKRGASLQFWMLLTSTKDQWPSYGCSTMCLMAYMVIFQQGTLDPAPSLPPPSKQLCQQLPLLRTRQFSTSSGPHIFDIMTSQQSTPWTCSLVVVRQAGRCGNSQARQLCHAGSVELMKHCLNVLTWECTPQNISHLSVASAFMCTLEEMTGCA